MRIFISIIVAFVISLVTAEFLQERIYYSLFIAIPIGLVIGVLTYLALGHNKTE